MSANVQGEFIAKIMTTLQKNGFPEKKVSLPLEKLYESAAAKGINFNRILEFLEAHDGIFHKKEGDRIIFNKGPFQSEAQTPPESGFPGFEALKNMNLGGMMSQVQAMMKNLTPDQIAQAQDMMKNMSPDQLSGITDMMKNLTPEQLRELKEQAEKFMKKN